MPGKYYIILGVPATSSQDDIKAAYRRLAKEFHPDCYQRGRAHFQKIQEAYSVLSDPVKRRVYDDQSHARKAAIKKRAGGIRVESMNSRRAVEPEPLRPGQVPAGPDEMVWGPTSHQHLRPIDTLFERFFRNIIDRREDAGGSVRQVSVEVRLSPEQASRGGRVRIKVLVEVPCVSCAGYGIRYRTCLRCNGLGFKTGEYPVEISYPPGVSDYDNMPVSLNRYGMGTLNLLVRFRVSQFFR